LLGRICQASQEALTVEGNGMRLKPSAFHAAAILMLLHALPAASEEPKQVVADPSKKPDAAATIAADKSALAPWQAYIGQWKGVGQLRRGSTQGAWTETAEWAWQFDKSRAAVAFQSPRGKYYISGRIVPGEKPRTFELIATRAVDKADNATSENRFTGAANAQGEFVFLLREPEKQSKPSADATSAAADKAAADKNAQQPARITVRQVADGKRLLMLYERRLPGAEQYIRLAEVGYTREGSGFAKAGSGSPECIVTGGLGTIAVQFEGKTYYVCCTGCRELFDDDPAGVLADYRARKAKEKSSE